jgi:hypothetical protein
MKNKFPKWAPAVLVNLYEIHLEKPIPDRYELLEEALLRKGFTSEQAKAKAKKETDKSYFLPEREKTQLIQKLLTDDRMESVWRAIGKRASKSNRPYHEVLHGIEHAITGWRRDLKLSATDKRAYYFSA